MESGACRLSVICCTYNQIDYIAKCLDSLISQKTSFPFQIIVHDDASTDGTASIVKDYAERYPGLIVPILQEQNKYSQGESVLSYVDPYLKGDYIAICEGDDWWIDRNKLQSQFDYMESHPNCSLCVHDSYIYEDSLRAYVGQSPASGVERDLPVESLIENGGWYISTNSFFYRRKFHALPDLYKGWGVGDYPTMVHLALSGSVHFLDKPMSAYRSNAAGSWTQAMQFNIQLRQETNRKIVEGLKRLDAETNCRYHDSVEVAVFKLEKQICELKHNPLMLFRHDRAHLFKSLSTVDKFKSIMRCTMPLRLIALLTKMKLKMKAFAFNNRIQ